MYTIEYAVDKQRKSAIEEAAVYGTGRMSSRPVRTDTLR